MPSVLLLGLVHQLTGSLWMTFSSTMAPVVPSRVQAARHQPQALARVIWTV